MNLAQQLIAKYDQQGKGRSLKSLQSFVHERLKERDECFIFININVCDRRKNGDEFS